MKMDRDRAAGRTGRVAVGLYTVINKVVIVQGWVNYESCNSPWKNDKATWGHDESLI